MNLQAALLVGLQVGGQGESFQTLLGAGVRNPRARMAGVPARSWVFVWYVFGFFEIFLGYFGVFLDIYLEIF